MKKIMGINKVIRNSMVEHDMWKEKDLFWDIRDENITYKRFRKIMDWLERNNWILYDKGRNEYIWIYNDSPKFHEMFKRATPL